MKLDDNDATHSSSSNSGDNGLEGLVNGSNINNGNNTATSSTSISARTKTFLEREIVDCQDFVLALTLGLLVGSSIVFGFFLGILLSTEAIYAVHPIEKPKLRPKQQQTQTQMQTRNHTMQQQQQQQQQQQLDHHQRQTMIRPIHGPDATASAIQTNSTNKAPNSGPSATSITKIGSSRKTTNAKELPNSGPSARTRTITTTTTSGKGRAPPDGEKEKYSMDKVTPIYRCDDPVMDWKLQGDCIGR